MVLSVTSARNQVVAQIVDGPDHSLTPSKVRQVLLDAIDSLSVAAPLSAFKFQGTWDASAGTFPGAGSAFVGFVWLVSVAGTVNSQVFDVGDQIIAIADNASTTTFSGNWMRVQGTVTAADISDASANGRSLIKAANYAAMKTLLAIASGDVSGLGPLATASGVTSSQISDATTQGKAILTAVSYSAIKTLLSIAAGDVSGLGSLATASSVTSSQISDATTQGKAILTAASYSAIKTLLAIAAGDVSGLGSLATASSVTSSQISDATTQGKAILVAASYAAIKTLLAIAASDVSGLGSLATLSTAPVANGGTGQTSAAAARGSTGLIVENYTGVGDAAYTILASDQTVGTTASLTTSRTWTLPAASAVNKGQRLFIADFAGGVTVSNTLVIARAGSDTINGSTSITINSTYGAYILISDGVSKWTAQAIGASATAGVASFNTRTGAVTLQASDLTALNALLSNTAATLSVGYKFTAYNLGTVSSGTVTPDAANGNNQYLTNNGAFTLAAPAADSNIDLDVLNGASAGSITFSGFTVSAVVGDALTTTNTNRFKISIRRVNGVSTYTIKAYQ